MRARRSGFTLIELLLVVMIVGTLAAIVSANLSGSGQRAHLDATARSLVALGRAARARSAAEGRAYFLIVDGDLREVRLARQRDPLLAADPASGDDPELEGDATWLERAAWARAVPFEEGVKLAQALVNGEAPESGTVPRVCFAPDGSADEGAFDFQDPAGTNVRVVIEPANARTRILTPEEAAEAIAAGTALPLSGGTAPGGSLSPSATTPNGASPAPAPGGDE